jgi:hypothetical protein
MSATQTYRKSRVGVYPLNFGWGWQVMAPDRTRVSGGGYTTEADAKKAARHVWGIDKYNAAKPAEVAA